MECGVKEFLYWNYIEDISLCDSIIEYHSNSKEKLQGEVLGGYIPEVKDSIDVVLEGDLLQSYVFELQKVCDLYIEKFPYCDYYNPWGITQSVNIQHYRPGGGFKIWHCERGGNAEPFSSRHLVFMTYLNDVTDAGETEWFHQKIKIQPKKGLTVIWPADWTYTHRGVPSLTQHKYIVTGWFNYTDIGDFDEQ